MKLFRMIPGYLAVAAVSLGLFSGQPAYAVLQSAPNESDGEVQEASVLVSSTATAPVQASAPAPARRKIKGTIKGRAKATASANNTLAQDVAAITPYSKTPSSVRTDPTRSPYIVDPSMDKHPLAVEVKDASPVVKTVEAKPAKTYTRPRPAYVLDPGRPASQNQ